MARAATTSDVFNAVAEPQRRRVLSLLTRHEYPASSLADALDSSQPRASKQLHNVTKSSNASTRSRPVDRRSASWRSMSSNS